jgi:hypothetical protein
MNWEYRTLRPNRETGQLQINEEDVQTPAQPKHLLETANAWGQEGWELVNVNGEAWFFRRAKGAQAGSQLQGRQRPY